MNKHPFTTYIEPKVADFEKLTGIKVVIEAFSGGCNYRNKLIIELNAGGKVDGYMIMPGLGRPLPLEGGMAAAAGCIHRRPETHDPSWDPKDFFARFAKSSSIDGKQIASSSTPRPRCWRYRKDLFTSSIGKCRRP